MSVVALITNEESIEQVVAWSDIFAKARSVPLVFACWTHSAVRGLGDPETVSPKLVAAVRACLEGRKMAEPPEIMGIDGPQVTDSIIDFAKKRDGDLIVAASDDPSGKRGGSLSTNPLLKQSPVTTVILFGGADRSNSAGRVFVGATDNINDAAAFFLGGQIAESRGADFTLARAELESGPEGQAIGHRELDQLIRNAGLPRSVKADKQIFETGDYEEAAASMDEHDLVLFGANYRSLAAVLELVGSATVAVVKRVPPIRPWQAAKRPSIWSTSLSPADYAELAQGLRSGSKLGADFITMLSLAAVVASLGLLQNSPAVVIGSMLLAPLMTPMIGCGLALAQGHQRLGTSALGTVAVGLLCTLTISFLIGVITPGTELTPQIYARGAPTVLDLFVAVASAAAASYALARPNLVGSIAGVAIATALVPPLCSVGISLAYSNFSNAQGAALLFATNFLAIVLCAALTFRLLGITPRHAKVGQKFWVFRVVAIFATAIIIVTVPLQHQLFRSLVETKPQPHTFPLAKAVLDAIEERAEAEPGVRLISAGAPSSQLAYADVVIILGATGKADPILADELTTVVREQMDDDSLVVEVHCVAELWQEITE